jgi:hypothetical protein
MVIMITFCGNISKGKRIQDVKGWKDKYIAATRDEVIAEAILCFPAGPCSNTPTKYYTDYCGNNTTIIK